MQHQITTGEQIGAATQAEAAQAEAARLRAGVAAGAQPLATDHKVTGLRPDGVPGGAGHPRHHGRLTRRA